MHPRSTSASGTIFLEDLVMKILLRPFFLFHLFKKSSCQQMAKECTLSTGKLPPRGLPRNSVSRINDRPEKTSAVCRRRKPTNQNIHTVYTQNKFEYSVFPQIFSTMSIYQDKNNIDQRHIYHGVQRRMIFSYF